MKLSTFLITLVLLSSFSAMAQSELQRFTVAPMEAPRTVAVFPDHPDKAAIIFESTLTNLRFDSQMDGIVQIRDEYANGRYILIIEPFTQIISITAPGFIQERLRIGTPEPREVRYFSVAPEERRQDVISVIFNVTPSDARLFVDDQQTDINQTVQIEPGNRDIRIEREGYRTIEESIVVTTSNISFTYSLSEIDIVAVQVQSNIIGANVVIDGTLRGQIDRGGGLGFFLYPGSYALVVNSDGYLPVSTTLLVEEDGENIVNTNLVRNIGELQLTVSPTDAIIMINRQVQQRQGLIELIPGRYQLDVEKEGHLSYSETIEIGLNERVSREVSLIQNIGELQLTVSPADAHVMINRQDYSGQRNIDLAPGRYRIDVEKEFYEPYSESIDITLNQRLDRVITLEAHTGALQFSVSPSNARVELVDASGRVVNRWTGIQILRDLQAGSYTIKASAEGHLNKEESIRIQRNQTAQVSLELEEGIVENWDRVHVRRLVEVTNPTTGRIWMDRNLGATRVARRSNHSRSYGYLFQWGRGADGHQKRNSATTTTISITDQPNHESFILISDNPFNWRNRFNNKLWQGVNGTNNPCPIGYRIPTEAEWNAERQSWTINNSKGALDSSLKLPMAGRRLRSDGNLYNIGSSGFYWSSTVSGASVKILNFNENTAFISSGNRALGQSVRCIKD